MSRSACVTGCCARSGEPVIGQRRDNGRWGASQTVAEGDSFFVNWADVPGVQPLGREGLVAHWLWRTGAETYAYIPGVSWLPP